LPPRRWLISARADFWFASAGAASALLAAIAWISFHGDRELDSLDFVLSEFHIGATYDAIVRRRLWSRLPSDVIIVPSLIVLVTFALTTAGYPSIVSSIAMYAAIWHRGRQNFGVARYYQRLQNGPMSALHHRLFQGAIYVPMLAAAFMYSHLAPDQYEGEPYFAFNAGPVVAWGMAIIALVAVCAYLIWAYTKTQQQNEALHPGEIWIVLAHAVAFGSGYVLGAAHASFLFVLTVHHEVQYLYFTYALAKQNRRSGIPFAASFALWPLITFAVTVISNYYEIGWLASLGVAGLFCHYWLDGRIWLRRAMAR
jgi:hypothetical protein